MTYNWHIQQLGPFWSRKNMAAWSQTVSNYSRTVTKRCFWNRNLILVQLELLSFTVTPAVKCDGDSQRELWWLEISSNGKGDQTNLQEITEWIWAGRFGWFPGFPFVGQAPKTQHPTLTIKPSRLAAGERLLIQTPDSEAGCKNLPTPSWDMKLFPQAESKLNSMCEIGGAPFKCDCGSLSLTGMKSAHEVKSSPISMRADTSFRIWTSNW